MQIISGPCSKSLVPDLGGQLEELQRSAVILKAFEPEEQRVNCDCIRSGVFQSLIRLDCSYAEH